MEFELKSLETLKYAQLQALCKKNGIKANQKKVKLIEELKNLHEENAPKVGESVAVENNESNESCRRIHKTKRISYVVL